MTRKPVSTDGFVIPRRPRPESQARLDKASHVAPSPLGQTYDPGLSRSPVKNDASTSTSALPPLELPESSKDQKAKKKRRFGFRKPSKKTVKRSLLVLGVLLLLVGGYFVYKFILTGNQIFKGNPLNAIFSGKELKMDANGRSNILIFGTSEDDPDHEGADLTDSMMVVSIDQKKKDAFIFSIPRDLYVDYGAACPSGFKGKINVVYLCHKEESGEDGGQTALRQKVGEVFGLDVQYSVHINYTVLREAVDAVGGITVQIESDDPRGILDRNFDWDCPNGPSTCYNVKYENGPAQLNGKQALYLARARGADPLGRTYGLGQANFDREIYQRKILIALKDKAASAGTLANPVAVNNLLSALGNNVRTNFESDEIRTLVDFGQALKNDNIRSIALNDKEKPLVTTGSVGGESIVQPTAGLFDYAQIQEVIKAYATGDTAFLEGAAIVVLNASETPGIAQAKADELEQDGLTIAAVDTAPASANTAAIQLIDQSNGGKPGTLKKLEKVLGIKATTTVPAGVGAEADFIVIVGKQTAEQ